MASISESLKKVLPLFSIGHKGPILGIDIGSSFIKVVLIEKVEEKVVLRNYGEIALGPRAGVAVGQATNLPPEKIAEALKDLLKESGITANHTLIAIPFSASLLTVVELPDVAKKELDSMIPIEARRYIPVPITEVSLDWWVLPKSKSKASVGVTAVPDTEGAKPVSKIEVIIAAIHNDVIKKFGLEPFSVFVLDASRTFTEKVLSLARISNIDDENLSELKGKIRHFYDIHKIIESKTIQDFLINGEFKKTLELVLNEDFSNPEFRGDWTDGKLLDVKLFKNIDDEFEFIDLQYKYMDFKKIRAFSQAVIFGKKFAYDVHETSIGKLWFKFPLKILLVTQINRRGKNDE